MLTVTGLNKHIGFFLETREARRKSAKANKRRASFLRLVINLVFLNVPSSYLKRIQKVWGEEWNRKSLDLNQFLDRNLWIAFIAGVVAEWNAYNLIVCAFLALF
jgi:hypothetical protein